MMILILTIVFIFLCLIVGGNSTTQALVTLGGNLFVFFGILFAIYLGLHPAISTIIGCIIIALISLFFQNGINEKTKVAFYSVLLVIAISFLFIYLLLDVVNIQGFPLGQYAIRLSNGYSDNISSNMMYIKIAVILVVLIGSAIDTALSVSSSLYQIHIHNPKMKSFELFISGITIGRDIISTTINTLFFIFLAEYFILFVIFAQDFTFAQMINSKEFAQEVITITIAGSTSVLIIPISALLSSKLYRLKEID